MRVAIVTESFLPQMNGVTNTVCHMVNELQHSGHQPLVIAPAPGPSDYKGAPVVRARSVAMPGSNTFHLGLPDRAVRQSLAMFRPDVVHLASPIALGAVGLRAARQLGLPTVGAYQSDVGGFPRQYGGQVSAATVRWLGRIHRRAHLTLAPSRSAVAQLEAIGIGDAYIWGPGVDLDLFNPAKRNETLHEQWARGPHSGQEKVVVGYVGRLSADKLVRRLAEVSRIPGARLVVIGDGPDRAWLEQHVPDTTFTGILRGRELAQAFASLDVFVHTGEAETLCQTIQEAQASGVPVIAPAAGGPVDLVTDGQSGLLFDTTERPAFRRAVTTLVADPRLRATLGRKGQEAVAGRGWPSVVDELVNKHYPAALSGPHSSGSARRPG
jgi:phosphatidylinositol alpha 1,6-mannosyltransferase